MIQSASKVEILYVLANYLQLLIPPILAFLFHVLFVANVFVNIHFLKYCIFHDYVRFRNTAIK